MRIKRDGGLVVAYKPVPPEERRAAVDHLIKGMPGLKPGEKPAHMLLVDYRAGGRQSHRNR